jgi:hypothetical protein
VRPTAITGNLNDVETVLRGTVREGFPFPIGGLLDDGQFQTYGMTSFKDHMELYCDDLTKPIFVVTPASPAAARKWVFDHHF